MKLAKFTIVSRIGQLLMATLLISSSACAQGVAQERFQELDRDGDGRVSAAEFGNAKRFRQFDLDGNGYVTPDEIRQSRRGDKAATSAAGHKRSGAGDATQSMAGQIRHTADVSYAGSSHHRLQTLDVYVAGDVAGETKQPVMVMVHGGGWSRGDKANRSIGLDKANFFVPRGMVYVALNYRLSPEVRHPEHVRDVARALAWVHDNIAAYGGDPERMVLMGHSAGAHLAALSIMDESYLAALGKRPDMFKGVILLDGAGYDISLAMAESDSRQRREQMYESAFGNSPSAWRSASPLEYVSSGKRLPQFLVFHQSAGRDWRVEVQQRFVSRLQTAGYRAQAVGIAGKNHEAMSADVGKPGDPLTLRIAGFLDELFPATAMRNTSH